MQVVACIVACFNVCKSLKIRVDRISCPLSLHKVQTLVKMWKRNSVSAREISLEINSHLPRKPPRSALVFSRRRSFAFLSSCFLESKKSFSTTEEENSVENEREYGEELRRRFARSGKGSANRLVGHDAR